MNWYKRQIKVAVYNTKRSVPEDEKNTNPYLYEDSQSPESDFLDEQEKWKQEDALSHVKDNERRFNNKAKAAPFEEELNVAMEKLKNPLLSKEEKNKIEKEIKDLENSISNLLRGPNFRPTFLDPDERYDRYSVEKNKPIAYYRVKEIYNRFINSRTTGPSQKWNLNIIDIANEINRMTGIKSIEAMSYLLDIMNEKR